MNNVTLTPRGLSEKEARALAKRIVKDNVTARVKRVLHVNSHDEQVEPTERAFTLKSVSDWEVCPLNERAKRNDRFAKEQPIEALMAANGTKRAA